MDDKNKVILTRLLKSGTKKAERFLIAFADDLKKEITKSKNNDEIFAFLDLLAQIIYKTPDNALKIISFITKKKKSLKPPIYKTKIGSYEGKTHKEIILKCIDLLREIRYIKFDEVFDLAINLFLSDKAEKGEVKNGAKDVLEKMVQYDYYVITSKIGYSAQRHALELISKWKKPEQWKRREIIMLLSNKILEPSFNGYSAKDENTVVFKSGALVATDFLVKIRRDTIDLLCDLFNRAKSEKDKIELLRVLDGATYMPMHKGAKEEIKNAIKADIEYLLGIYQKIIFDNRGKITKELGVVFEIDKQLVNLARNYKDEISEISKLGAEINEDENYSLFKLFIADLMEYKESSDWNEAKKRRGDTLNQIYKRINTNNADQWLEKFNLFASYYGIIDEWRFNVFAGFLSRLAKEKFQLADVIFEQSIKKNNYLKKYFSGNFMLGFRETNLSLWDKYRVILEEEKKIESLFPIISSMADTAIKELRKEDLVLLTNLIYRKGNFAFIEKGKINIPLAFWTIGALCNFHKKDPKKIERLITKELKNNPELIDTYIRRLDFAQYQGDIKLEKFQKETIKTILNGLVESEKLNHDAELIMGSLIDKYYEDVMSVFLKRIEKKSKEKARPMHYSRYSAVPYHLEHGLRDKIINNPKYSNFLEQVIKSSFNRQINLFDMKVGHLIDRLGGPTNEVLMKMIKEGDQKTLWKISGLFNPVEGADYDLCFEIIKRFKPKNEEERKIVWGRIRTAIMATGVVSGEYGPRDAYKRKLKMIKSWKVGKNENLKNFVKDMKERLNHMINAEEKSTKEDIVKRKIEFEG